MKGKSQLFIMKMQRTTTYQSKHLSYLVRVHAFQLCKHILGIQRIHLAPAKGKRDRGTERQMDNG